MSGPRIDARHGDGPQQVVEIGLVGIGAILVSGLARKFWTMTSWMWPCARMQIADREQRLDALVARLADADQDAGGERHLQLAGEPDGLQPHGRMLVGRAVVRAALLAQPLAGRSPA